MGGRIALPLLVNSIDPYNGRSAAANTFGGHFLEEVFEGRSSILSMCFLGVLLVAMLFANEIISTLWLPYRE